MKAGDLPDPKAAQLPVVVARHERIVERGFWDKLLGLAGQLPFAEDLAAAYYCVADPATPARVKAILLAALAYFVLPTDAIPDFLPVIGFTDDAAVLALAFSMVSRNIRPEHFRAARRRLGILEPVA
ncbi:MAG TPA: YkvA family protein [Rhizomicrobium sp.]|nr:YkvA family protein [Rhizomicrobium sp.]